MAAMPEVMTCGEAQVSPDPPAGGEWAGGSGPPSDKDSASANWGLPIPIPSPGLALVSLPPSAQRPCCLMFLKHNHFLSTTFHDSPLSIAMYLKRGPVCPSTAGACPMVYMTFLSGVEELLKETK